MTLATQRTLSGHACVSGERCQYGLPLSRHMSGRVSGQPSGTYHNVHMVFNEYSANADKRSTRLPVGQVVSEHNGSVVDGQRKRKADGTLEGAFGQRMVERRPGRELLSKPIPLTALWDHSRLLRRKPGLPSGQLVSPTKSALACALPREQVVSVRSTRLPVGQVGRSIAVTARRMLSGHACVSGGRCQYGFPLSHYEGVSDQPSGTYHNVHTVLIEYMEHHHFP